MLLLFHSGGFVFDDPTGMKEAEGIAAEMGFKTVVVDYPLANLPGAVRTAERAARRYERKGRTVYAYGESAGGTLAALLATDDRVAAASTYSQVTSIRGLIRRAPNPGFFEASLRASDRQISRYSPGRGRSEVPLLALTPVDDDVTQNRATHRWARADPKVRTRDVEGGHLGFGDDPSIYPETATRALAWLARRADLR